MILNTKFNETSQKCYGQKNHTREKTYVTVWQQPTVKKQFEVFYREKTSIIGLFL